MSALTPPIRSVVAIVLVGTASLGLACGGSGGSMGPDPAFEIPGRYNLVTIGQDSLPVPLPGGLAATTYVERELVSDRLHLGADRSLMDTVTERDWVYRIFTGELLSVFERPDTTAGTWSYEAPVITFRYEGRSVTDSATLDGDRLTIDRRGVAWAYVRDRSGGR